jgi:cysteine desulfurase / selenocysteine lyase
MSLVKPEHFPAASKSTYLNCASVALMYSGAERAAVEWQQDIAQFGTLNFDEVAEDRVFDDLRAAFAALIGARADDIAVASSATELIASLAWAVAPARGKNIVGVDVVFPSTMYPWSRVARHTGCEVRWVRANDALVAEADLIAAIDRDTAVVSISHVEYGSGQRYDLARIAAAAHEQGALLVVDATQSAGAIPIDLASEPVDALITGSYKWLCGPFGVGLMYLAPHLQNRLDPGLVGWRSHKDIYSLKADRVDYADSARRFEFSTMAYGCAIGLTESIRYLHRIGVANIRSHNLALADRLLEHLRRLGAHIVSPATGDERTSIVSARFPGLTQTAVVAALGAQRIIVAPRRDFVRMSLHLYNTTEDVERVADVLHGLAK